MPTESVLQFRFIGGIADKHELNFYEAGRFLYGAARLIYTLEKFRQEGKVVRSLRTKVGADIRIRAARPGSFAQDILIMSVPLIAECAISVPLEALLAYFMDLMLPKSKGSDVAIAIAQAELEKERQKTAQFRELSSIIDAEQRTKQEKERTKQLELFSDIIKQHETTTQKALETTKLALKILESRINSSESVTFDGQTVSIDQLKYLQSELSSQYQREHTIQKYRDAIDNIPSKKTKDMLEQVRKPIKDISLPLRSSATALEIGKGGDSESYVHANSNTIEMVVSENVDETPTSLRGSVKMYDKETGYGKFRYEEAGRPLVFRVPAPSKNEFRDKILDAMKASDVLASFYIIRDPSGTPTSLIFNSLIDDE